MTTAKLFGIIVFTLLMSLPSLVVASDFSVLTYNAFMRSPTWIFHDEHDRRSREIPGFLKGYDAIVLQEVFSSRHREQLIKALEKEYPHNSGVLGEGQFLPMNGGVIILSRWPIEQKRTYKFSNCRGSDCMVSKGIIYTAIEKQDLRVNLFGLHLQAQLEYGNARIQQFSQLGDFIARQEIPKEELLLVAGDFNVNYFSRESDGEYDLLTSSLELKFNEHSPAPSYEKDSNTMVLDSVTERLDYVFYSNKHRVPTRSSTEVLHFRKDQKDLSDHHAVVGRFSLDTNGREHAGIRQKDFGGGTQ
jgi:endonuclease/exonuclease/phosphatase family metal-dependent hydrolase